MIPLTEEKLKNGYADRILDIYSFRGDLNVILAPKDIPEISRFLKTDSDLKYNFLSCITAVDYLGKREKRFEVVYILYSISNHLRIILKTQINENDEIPTLTSVWGTANWQEREVYDMFGIKFSDHHHLTRILMDDDWIGHPQRKDFPLTYEAPNFSHNRHDIDTSAQAQWRGDEWLPDQEKP